MSGATARPWRISANAWGWAIEGADGKPTSLGSGDNIEQFKANAAFIVKSVNAHDSLVGALEKACRDLRDYGAAPIQQVREEMKRALEEAKG